MNIKLWLARLFLRKTRFCNEISDVSSLGPAFKLLFFFQVAELEIFGDKFEVPMMVIYFGVEIGIK